MEWYEWILGAVAIGLVCGSSATPARFGEASTYTPRAPRPFGGYQAEEAMALDRSLP